MDIHDGNIDSLIEHLRKKLNITKEQEDKEIEEQRAKNPVPQLQLENEQLKRRVEYAEEALLALMEMGMM